MIWNKMSKNRWVLFKGTVNHGGMAVATLQDKRSLGGPGKFRWRSYINKPGQTGDASWQSIHADSFEEAKAIIAVIMKLD